MAATSVARWERRFSVMDLHLQCVPRDDIAAILGIAQGTVSNDITAIVERFAAPLEETNTAIRNKLIAQIDLAIGMAFERWRKTGFSKHGALVAKFFELKAKLFGFLKDKMDLNLSTVPWDELARAALAETSDPIEARLAELNALTPLEASDDC